MAAVREMDKYGVGCTFTLVIVMHYVLYTVLYNTLQCECSVI